MLEKILGYEPPPPPPDVPAIVPDIRGALTIREQLEKHREVETCAECHRKIDPLGFALENFNAIGEASTMSRKPRLSDRSIGWWYRFESFDESRSLIISQVRRSDAA